MITASTALNEKKTLFMIVLLLVTIISIFLDIPVLGSILSFLFFTTVPGFLILSILKPYGLSFVEKLVLSIGLSVSFLMFVGLAINWILPYFGYDSPLTMTPLIISFSIVTCTLIIIAYLRSRNYFTNRINNSSYNFKEKAYLILPCFFPILSISGIYVMNAQGNNIILMILLILIPAYIVFITIKHKQVPHRIFPPMLFLISISLTLLLGLRSNHVIGTDVHTEYYLFQQTLQNGHWQIRLNAPLDSCLSISILPTIYQSFMKIDPEYLFKILYPLLFSISPLIVYSISKKYLGNFQGMLASMFFISQALFLGASSNPRTSLAILFFALALMALFHDRLSNSIRTLLTIVFITSCIISHYATTYIFLAVLVLTWTGIRIIPIIRSTLGRLRRSIKSSVSYAEELGGYQTTNIKDHLNYGNRNLISLRILMPFIALMFLWQSQLTGRTFTSAMQFVYTTLRSIRDFFLLESRGEVISEALGSSLGTAGITQYVIFISSWLTIAFIALALLVVFIKWRSMVTSSNERSNDHSESLQQRFDMEFFILSIACAFVLLAASLLPFIFAGYGATRTYGQMIIILSPFFVIGGITIAKLSRIRWAYSLVLLALIPYFMGATGVVHELFGDPGPITLSSTGNEYNTFYIYEQEVTAAKWINDEVSRSAIIHASARGQHILISQGEIHPNRIISNIAPRYKDSPEIGGYIYLRYIDIRDSQKPYENGEIVLLRNILAEMSVIYTTNNSQVYGL